MTYLLSRLKTTDIPIMNDPSTSTACIPLGIYAYFSNGLAYKTICEELGYSPGFFEKTEVYTKTAHVQSTPETPFTRLAGPNTMLTGNGATSQGDTRSLGAGAHEAAVLTTDFSDELADGVTSDPSHNDGLLDAFVFDCGYGMVVGADSAGSRLSL